MSEKLIFAIRQKMPFEVNKMNDWILHLQHPLVLAGLGMLICTLIIRQFGHRKRFGGKAELLMSIGRVILPVVALLAVVAGLVMSWKTSAVSLNSQAVLCYHEGKYEEAERLYKKSVKVAEETFGKDHLNIAAVLNNLSELYQEQKRYSEAEIVLDRAFKIIEKEGSLYNEDAIDIINSIALISGKLDKLDKSEVYYLKEIDILKKISESDFGMLSIAANNLAGCLLYTSPSPRDLSTPRMPSSA